MLLFASITDWIWVVYLVPLLLIWRWHARKRRRIEVASRSAHQMSQRSGLTEPVSLHPIIDASRCVGCGACIKACPEQPESHVLGLIDGKAELSGCPARV
jgi:ferredoxin